MILDWPRNSLVKTNSRVTYNNELNFNNTHKNVKKNPISEFLGREQWWWTQNVRGINGRSLGIIDTEGSTWIEQRRFALKHLRDLGFGRKALDSIMIEEADQVIDREIFLFYSSQICHIGHSIQMF